MIAYIVLIKKEFIYDTTIIKTVNTSKRVFAKTENNALLNLQKTIYENSEIETLNVIRQYYKEGNLQDGLDLDKVKIDISLNVLRWHRYIFDNHRFGKKHIKNIKRMVWNGITFYPDIDYQENKKAIERQEIIKGMQSLLAKHGLVY